MGKVDQTHKWDSTYRLNSKLEVKINSGNGTKLQNKFALMHYHMWQLSDSVGVI